MPESTAEQSASSSQCVAILGAGSWGTALSTLLGRCARVLLWARDVDLVSAMAATGANERYLPGITLNANTRPVCDLAAALGGVDAVVFAVPSGAMRQVAEAAAPLVPRGALVVNASKGLEGETGRTMGQVIAESLAAVWGVERDVVRRRVVALSGPNLAVEVARGIPTASVSAAMDLHAAAECQALWMGPTFRVYTSSDPIGVELAGAMKNVIAIGAGICEGLGYGDNSRGALLTRGLAEITRVGVALGSRPATFLGLAGVGDLIATGGSRLSRNYRVGIGLGQGRSLAAILDELGQVAEGVPTTRAVCALADRLSVDVPIARALSDLMFAGARVDEVIEQLMLRPPREECEF